MEDAVASLTKSFALVPPAAVPAIVDCIIASSCFEPSLLFSSLVRAIPDPAEVFESNCILSHAVALCHLIKLTPSNDAMELFIWKVFVPMVKSVEPNDTELINQGLGLFCDVVLKTHSWELIGTILVPFCLESLAKNLGLTCNEELTIYRWSIEDGFEQKPTGITRGSLPLLISCRILISLLKSALESERETHSSERKIVDGFGDSGCFSHNLLWDLSNMVIEILTQSTEHRSRVIRLILPHILRSFCDFASVRVMVNGSACTLSRIYFLKKIWACCVCLFSLGHEERIDAYNILSMCFSSFKVIDGCGRTSEGELSEKYDLSNEKEFWKEIRRGLVDKDPFLRKQALYVLKVSLCNCYDSVGNKDDEYCSSASRFTVDSKNGHTISSNVTHAQTKRGKWADKEAKSMGVGEVCHLGTNGLSSQERWTVFILLYEMLEEYGTHLVEAAWMHQVSLFLESGPFSTCMIATSCAVYQVQMDTLDGIFNWLSVLWERGLFHENPQVRCLIMDSFLSISWDKYADYAQKVPRSFVLGPFILGLNDVVHHKDFGVKGVYMSSTIHGATKYLHEYSRQMSLSERIELVCGLASIARQDSFGRAGLMALAFCIASAAGTVKHDDGEVYYSMNDYTISEIKEAESSQENPLSSRAAELLDVLGVVVERSKQHFNPRYRLRVCEQVLKAATSVISICDVPTDILLHFLSNVPREFTDFTGPLRGLVQQWLNQNGCQPSKMGSAYGNKELLERLAFFPRSFISKHSADACVSFDDEDVDAWELEGQRWARVLFLVVWDEHLEPIFKFLQNNTMSLCTEEGVHLKLVPIKLLILIQSFVEEFEIGWRRYTNYIEPRAWRAVDVTNKLDESTSLFNPFFREKFIRKFTPMLGDLLSYAKSVSPVFWSISSGGTELPHSIKGKLGGPSQRRLSSHTTSDVLQAIISMRTVSSISSWCLQLKSDDCLNPSFAFLWEFSWKVIRSLAYNSETGAELHLAAYESLVYVFKAFSTAFTPLVIDFVSAFNMSLQADEGNNPLLDPLVHSFMQNVNDLLTEGILTRSRRAVLMNWKWLCLDSLLSIPGKIMEYGSYSRNIHAYFSDSTLAAIFADIVGSLENAGEGSMLPMLRSVRLVMGLISCGRMNEITQFSSGVNYQFIMQLVQSSLILHLSCNKRRVAPIAALLSAILHRSVFSVLSMHKTIDGEEGPLKWFIHKLLNEGVKSPRTIRLAALHLTGLWLVNPKTIEFYIEELKLLSLYGSVAFDEDFEAELSENLEARSEVSLLAQSPDQELTEQFINTEMYARVSVAVLFHKLAHLPDRIGGEENRDYQASRKCGKIFLAELLDYAVNDKDLAKELYKKFSGVHRRKVRLWQMICILSHFVDDDIVGAVTSRLHVCLCRNNLPGVRQYLEIFAMQIYLKFPALVEQQLLPIFYNYNMRPQALSSYVFIATNVILHAGDLPMQLKHLHGLLPSIIPFLTSHHHSLRGFTQLLVYHVLCKLWPALGPGASEVAPLEKKCFEDLKLYLAENPDCVRLRASMEGFLDAFDPVKSATPTGVFNARDEGLEFECVPVSLMEHVITFLNDVRNDLRDSIAKDDMAIKNESITHADSCKDSAELLKANEDGAFPLNRIDFSLDFQKKITVQEYGSADHFLGDSEPPKLLLEMEKEDQLLRPVIQLRNQAVQRIKESQQQFIFVASLLDRIPNIAGLARTCEVFKAAGLAVSDASIIHDKQFQLISVTAEKWVPIIEVPVFSLKVFLEKKKREGFSILGLEQTANSVPLDQYSFPRKTVLVLGREKEGIPVDIIHALDACVEIPQLGIIRSLNVHVSGAIALWEYTRQQRSKQL